MATNLLAKLSAQTVLLIVEMAKTEITEHEREIIRNIERLLDVKVLED